MPTFASRSSPAINFRRDDHGHEYERASRLSTSRPDLRPRAAGKAVGRATPDPTIHSDDVAIQLEPLAVSVREATRLLGIGRTHLYQQVSDGHLVARKIGSRTLITMASIKELLRDPDLEDLREDDEDTHDREQEEAHD